SHGSFALSRWRGLRALRICLSQLSGHQRIPPGARPPGERSGMTASGWNSADEQWMQRACELALLGLNSTTPNPRVGCVLVNKQGELVAEGYHRRAGDVHAEIDALRNAGEAARGCTVYVT